MTLKRDFATDKRRQKEKICRWIHLASNLNPVTWEVIPANEQVFPERTAPLFGCVMFRRPQHRALTLQSAI